MVASLAPEDISKKKFTKEFNKSMEFLQKIMKSSLNEKMLLRNRSMSDPWYFELLNRKADRKVLIELIEKHSEEINNYTLDK